MFKNAYKNFIIVIPLIVVLSIITVFNVNNKNNYRINDQVYKNELSKKIASNDIDDVNYDFLNKDLMNIDDIMKEQVSLELDNKKKSKYYEIASNIYSNKINELTMVLNYKLDDEDFYRLVIDLDDFQKNIDFAVEDLNNKLDSTLDIELYTNKYVYEEKQKKCREILETYRGFLQ